MIVVNAYVIYNIGCYLKSGKTMIRYELRRKLVLSKLDLEQFGGRDHLASVESRQRVFKHKASTSSVPQENNIRNIKEY